MHVMENISRCRTFSYFLLVLLCIEQCCASKLSFFVIADWGGVPFWPYTTPPQIAVSQNMEALAKMYKFNFVLSLGDHFYTKGVYSATDPRFNETYEHIYNAGSLQLPWYAVAGNHDYYGNITAQLAYSKMSKYWKYPDFYYKMSFVIPGTSAKMDIVMIDTIILCGHTSLNDQHEQPILQNKDRGPSEDHWSWLEKTLKASNSSYLIVAGHFPVYSIAEHGNTKCLVERLSPLLEKYRVNAYLCGHDHNLQHIHPSTSDWTVEYFVAGAANTVDASTKNIHQIPPDSLKFHWGHFFSLGAICFVDVSNKTMNVNFIESNGKLLYKYSLLPRPLF